MSKQQCVLVNTALDLSIEEKIELITILCYYYNGQGVSKLETLINFLLRRTDRFMYSARKAVTQIHERHRLEDKLLLKHFKVDLMEFAVLRKDFEKLHLLLVVVESEGFQDEALSKTMHKRVFKDLTFFSTFVKAYLNKAVVFVIDGIDENRYFFHNHAINTISLKLFFLSSISEEVQSSLMAQHFYLALFYPKVNRIEIQDAIVRPDKFPTYSIEWDPTSLINYADQLLTKMNKTASDIRCKPLTSFESVVNYGDEKIRVIIEQISTPRELHFFITELILEMNTHAKDARQPFVATVDNAKNAFQKVRKLYGNLER